MPVVVRPTTFKGGRDLVSSKVERVLSSWSSMGSSASPLVCCKVSSKEQEEREEERMIGSCKPGVSTTLSEQSSSLVGGTVLLAGLPAVVVGRMVAIPVVVGLEVPVTLGGVVSLSVVGRESGICLGV